MLIHYHFSAFVWLTLLSFLCDTQVPTFLIIHFSTYTNTNRHTAERQRDRQKSISFSLHLWPNDSSHAVIHERGVSPSESGSINHSAAGHLLFPRHKHIWQSIHHGSLDTLREEGITKLVLVGKIEFKGLFFYHLKLCLPWKWRGNQRPYKVNDIWQFSGITGKITAGDTKWAGPEVNLSQLPGECLKRLPMKVRVNSDWYMT